MKRAKQSQNAKALKAARSQVHTNKVALGERGPIWWDDGTPDDNRYLAQNTPYADWDTVLSSQSKTEDWAKQHWNSTLFSVSYRFVE